MKRENGKTLECQLLLCFLLFNFHFSHRHREGSAMRCTCTSMLTKKWKKMNILRSKGVGESVGQGMLLYKPPSILLPAVNFTLIPVYYAPLTMFLPLRMRLWCLSRTFLKYMLIGKNRLMRILDTPCISDLFEFNSDHQIKVPISTI